MKIVRAKDVGMPSGYGIGSREVDFHGQRHSKATHHSIPVLKVWLARRGAGDSTP